MGRYWAIISVFSMAILEHARCKWWSSKALPAGGAYSPVDHPFVPQFVQQDGITRGTCNYSYFVTAADARGYGSSGFVRLSNGGGGQHQYQPFGRAAVALIVVRQLFIPDGSVGDGYGWDPTNKSDGPRWLSF